MTIQPLSGQRQKKESDNAVLACNDYLRLGGGRSLQLLLDDYSKFDQIQPPSKSIGTLKYWSVEFEWQQRASLYDAESEQQRDEQAQANLEKYLALKHWRVQKLVELADFLESQLYEQGEGGDYHNVWLPDVKQIGSGAGAERVDLERFNAPLISEYRAALDDIAKETGGRIKKSDITSGGKSVQFIWDDDDDNSGHNPD